MFLTTANLAKAKSKRFDSQHFGLAGRGVGKGFLLLICKQRPLTKTFPLHRISMMQTPAEPQENQDEKQFGRQVLLEGVRRLRADGLHTHSRHLIGSAGHLLQRHCGIVSHVECQRSNEAVSSALRRTNMRRTLH
ncbi:hypothetical protein EYF80_056693 [Liparis tanakae]|uniref:Uncharacterized protein n=1 Tax=Liparis tanakae TaxID=230148 RepID=A0A4Z2EX36_9TELE|nr:hypothetical protein EYF80_056693 [Liparis tanakae]